MRSAGLCVCVDVMGSKRGRPNRQAERDGMRDRRGGSKDRCGGWQYGEGGRWSADKRTNGRTRGKTPSMMKTLPPLSSPVFV